MPIVLQPSVIAALVERFGHGRVVLTREEYFDAARLLIDVQENDRGEFVLTTFRQVRVVEESKPWWQES